MTWFQYAFIFLCGAAAMVIIHFIYGLCRIEQSETVHSICFLIGLLAGYWLVNNYPISV
jgi:hypothetical protein